MDWGNIGIMDWGDIGIILTIIFAMLFYLGGMDRFAKILFAELSNIKAELSDIKTELKEINSKLFEIQHKD